MHVQLTREAGQDARKTREILISGLITNILEIAAAVVMVFLVMLLIGKGVEETIAQLTAIICLGIVTWGAVSDIGKLFDNIADLRREEALQESYIQLENLNREMRTQRHDFMNHIQVIYSLIEMEEPEEALKYIDKLFGDMQRVSRMLRTDSPAVNALLQAKDQDAKRHGIEFVTSISGRWGDPMFPEWEICRILANLIDNAMDAIQDARIHGVYPQRIELRTGENDRCWFFSVENNGPNIPEETLQHIFDSGFTTKSTGHGMGLYIVKTMIEEMNGEITVESQDQHTVFSAYIPRARLQLPEGKSQEPAEELQTATA